MSDELSDLPPAARVTPLDQVSAGRNTAGGVVIRKVGETPEPESCTTCRFVKISIDGPNPYMACHRYPRLIIVVDGEPATTWPTVHEGDWCGEFDREESR